MASVTTPRNIRKKSPRKSNKRIKVAISYATLRAPYGRAVILLALPFCCPSRLFLPDKGSLPFGPLRLGSLYRDHSPLFMRACRPPADHTGPSIAHRTEADRKGRYSLPVALAGLLLAGCRWGPRLCSGWPLPTRRPNRSGHLLSGTKAGLPARSWA